LSWNASNDINRSNSNLTHCLTRQKKNYTIKLEGYIYSSLKFKDQTTSKFKTKTNYNFKSKFRD